MFIMLILITIYYIIEIRDAELLRLVIGLIKIIIYNQDYIQ